MEYDLKEAKKTAEDLYMKVPIGVLRYITALENEIEKQLQLHVVRDTLIAWEQFKKANWYESEAIDVEKMLMYKFQEIHGR